jgi:hypothetical protein
MFQLEFSREKRMNKLLAALVSTLFAGAVFAQAQPATPATPAQPAAPAKAEAKAEAKGEMKGETKKVAKKTKAKAKKTGDAKPAEAKK